MRVADMFSILFEIAGKELNVKYLDEQQASSHYGHTPYRYTPKTAQKIIPNQFVDLGQGLLDIVEELDRKVGINRTAESSSDNYGIEGTAIGFDKETQYNTIVDTGSGLVKFYREVEGTISITLPIDAMARIVTVTNEKESTIDMNGDSAINIEIRQTN